MMIISPVNLAQTNTAAQADLFVISLKLWVVGCERVVLAAMSRLRSGGARAVVPATGKAGARAALEGLG